MLNDAAVHTIGRKLFVYNTMTFGEWLREKLNEKGISNAELARRAKVSPTYIGNLIRDFSPNMRSARSPRASEPVVERIAKGLGVSANEARKAAGYASIENDDEDGLFAGLSNLAPDQQQLARRQIRAIIDSFAIEDREDVD